LLVLKELQGGGGLTFREALHLEDELFLRSHNTLVYLRPSNVTRGGSHPAVPSPIHYPFYLKLSAASSARAVSTRARFRL
jgi:hypothetical protein